MARTLEFKQRVRLPPDEPVEPRVKRRANPAFLRVALWFGMVFLAYTQIRGGLARAREAREVAYTERAVRARTATAEPARLEPPPVVEREPEPAPAPLPEPEPAPAPAPITAAPANEPEAPRVAVVPREPLRSARPDTEQLPRTPGKRRTLQARPTPDLGLDRPWSASSRVPDFEEEPLESALGATASEPPLPRAPRADVPRAQREPEEKPDRERFTATETGSCESAVARYNEEMDLGHPNGAPDISASVYASILDNGAYFAHCGVPASTRVNICAAVQHGQAIGVTVRTAPTSASAERCIRNAVRRLRFPSHPKLDVTRTEFAPR